MKRYLTAPRTFEQFRDGIFFDTQINACSMKNLMTFCFLLCFAVTAVAQTFLSIATQKGTDVKPIGLTILPNGNIAFAGAPLGGHKPYIDVLDSTGALVNSVSYQSPNFEPLGVVSFLEVPEQGFLISTYYDDCKGPRYLAFIDNNSNTIWETGNEWNPTRFNGSFRLSGD